MWVPQFFSATVSGHLLRRYLICSALGLAFAASLTSTAYAEEPAAEKNSDQTAVYVSQVDQDLTIRRVTVLPVIDNVEGIYARPIETKLIELMRASHRWDFVEANLGEAIFPPLVQLEESPSEMQRLTKSVDADAIVAASATRGPNGISIRLDLFLKKDGRLLSQELLRDYPHSNIAEVNDRIALLYRQVLARIPYQGIILSRQGNRVTINLGKSDGLFKDQSLTAIQIVSLVRHPKFGFIISTEKEILGRIKVLKVDETLSFGAIVAEKERGAIQRLAKISGIEQVTYPDPSGIDGVTAGDLGNRSDSALTFGKDPKEWIPAHPPSFGEVGMKAGLGSSDSISTTNGGTYEAPSAVFPSIAIHGEIWLTPNWKVRADIMEGVLSASNPRANSQPGTLSEGDSRYSLNFGYNFLLRDDFFGPKIEVSAGYASYRMYVDSSTPTSLTTVSYSGVVLGAGGSFPVTDDKVWTVGGHLNLWAFPNLNESPVSSGSSSTNSVTEFSIFVEKKLSQNLRAVGSLDFSLFNTTFGGQGTRVGADGVTPEIGSTFSLRQTVLSGGINYMF